MGKEIYMTNVTRIVGAPKDDWFTFYFMYADYDFIPAFDMQMKAGRSFSRDFPTDRKTVLVNEEALQLFGLKDPEDAIRQSILYYRDTMKIIGVVKDFHQLGLNVAIQPIIFMLKPDAHNFYSIKFNTPDIHQTTASIEQIWNRHYPSDPFSYFFLDEAFDRQYKSDLQFGKVFGLFAFLAIGIACFGLLSLSAYNVIQRTKEISIRKVLGASAGNIITMLNIEFFKLVLIGIFIATPIAWFIMKEWLNGYAYRISIQWWVFVLAGLLGVVVALLTVSYHAIRAAWASPCKSLRTE